MAKVKFTSTVSEIRGKVRGDVFKGIKDGFVLQDACHIPSRSSQFQQLTRSAVAYFASKWSTLSTGKQSLWNDYGAALTPPKSGQNLYIGYNVALLTARHPGLVEVDVPPVLPGVPGMPAYAIVNAEDTDGAFVATAAETAQLWTFWNYLASDDDYVKHFFSYLIGFRARGKERWRFDQTTEYEKQYAIIKLSEYAQYARRVRGKTVDPFGRVSAYSYIEANYPMANLLLDDCEDSSLWNTLNLVKGDGYRIVHGSKSLTLSADGTAQQQNAWFDFPDPIDMSAYRFLNFFFASTLGNVSIHNVAFRLQLIDNMAEHAWYYLGLPPTYWNWYHVDLTEMSVPNSEFDFTQVATMKIWYNFQEPQEAFNAWLDFLYLSELL